ncbi:zinc ribbon domain-containing protein [Gimesia fumaroli]|jgi:predicted  nucleic acid-binding Zn-ribbon protein|uniref:Zinc ribbon domain protein n=1 Tax=Gimesia fumaroli TaxID=2527976 RepID=A0A518IHJ5_9PLAN|nr:C4-type zinc ribbon domain-containing protein [Gimesia fumaroli]QDV52563.1 Putative zinc ribbon domain protein [Gimesia fumaroli]
MSTTAASLKALHHLYLRLYDVDQKLEQGPKRIKLKEQFALIQEEKLKEVQDQVLQLKKQVQQKNLDLQSNEAKILDLKGKLNSASSNKEFDIIKGQIAADEMANSVLEDEILELMDKIDKKEEEVQSWVKQKDAAHAEAKKTAQDFESARNRLNEEIEECKATIADAEQIIPESLKVMFARLVRSHGAGALAPVEGRFCSACNVMIEPQLRVELNSGRLVFCKSCGRLLYLEDTPE